MLKEYLDDLENRIDDTDESRLYNEWVNFIEGKYTGGLFEPKRSRISMPEVDWPDITINQTLDDVDTMILHQLSACSGDLENKEIGRLMCVRPNYGTGTLSSLFGTGDFIMEEASNTLPGAIPLEGGIPAIEKLVEKGELEVVKYA